MKTWYYSLVQILPLLLPRGALASQGITGALLVNSEGQPDPCIYYDNATSIYYCYADRGRLASSDQVNTGWTSEPNYEVLTADGKPFQGGIGAPSVGYLNNQYVLYFASGENIQVATSSSPRGPFNMQSNPLLKPASQPGRPVGKRAFPAAPALFQNNGDNYMLYKYGRAGDYNGVSAICIRQISDDGLTAIGDPTELFTVTSGVLQDGRQFTEDEGPNMVYNNGIFYLFFNAGSWCASDYQIVYATSDTLLPSQPYTYRGIFLETSPPTYDGVSLKAPGGISFVDPTTFIFMSYQPDAKLTCQKSNSTQAPPRFIHAGQLYYNNDGTVSVAESWSN